MREIRFRGKSMDANQWVYGYYIREDDTTFCFSSDYDMHPEVEHHYICFDEMSDWGLPNTHHKVEVDPNTISECCGITDKHGRMIFEGDIISAQLYGGSMSNQLVFFANGCFYCGWVPFHLLSGQYIEVVGNMYDNPDLICENKQ